ncbi:MAG TPA: RNA polymerase sigma factor [Kofleriaceae bacterium]|nr:RNA polymerase sigma factor [Kofleriaceae bacterium]
MLDLPARISRLYREESGRILATLIRALGDFDLAEDVLQEAFAAAIDQWPRDGAPDSPRAWLTSTARNKAIDQIRRRRALHDRRGAIEALAALAADERSEATFEALEFAHPARSRRPAAAADTQVEPVAPSAPLGDDRLRLIFTCCHPALATEAQVGLTLRTLCGLTTEEIARAFLVPVPTLAQRLVRAKAKIRGAGIPYQVPGPELLRERVEAVAAVIYLVFNEGYAATAGDALLRVDLCAESIRLCRLLGQLLPCEAEVTGLLALVLLHDARRPARVGPGGELVLLEHQDRGRWSRSQIDEALPLVERALHGRPVGQYAVQAAIAAVHARAARAADTDWPQIAALYAVLAGIAPSPVVELNRAAAVAMAEGPECGLVLLDRLVESGALPRYHLLPAARADLLRRLGRNGEAAAAYREAIALVSNEPERRFLAGRLAEVEAA